MSVEELEVKIKKLEEKVETLEKQVQMLQDIEEIKRLQRAYGYYLERWLVDDLLDLFSDSPEATLKIALGTFIGKESIKRFFYYGMSREEVIKQRTLNPFYLHQVMQLSGVVNVDPDGKRARGRWYGFGASALPTLSGRVKAGWMNGTYEVEYVKENGKWKILKIHWCPRFFAPMDSWVEPSRRADPTEQPHVPPLNPEGEGERRGFYPSTFVLPFHFKHPITGKETKTPEA
ncbi:MAG: nuclear transport factor 2 family protein [Candidatus Bathyarchaeia archaeon]